MNKKIRVAIIFGGRSAEHEVSWQSARNVYEALDKNKYEPVLIHIDRAGQWYLHDSHNLLLNVTSFQIDTTENQNLPIRRISHITEIEHYSSESIDVVIPVLHGPFGEDGTIQGLLKLANIPFVGAGVLGSAIGMDKDVMKRLLQVANIPVAKFKVFHSLSEAKFSKISQELGLPFFIKPANLGSSVGVHKVHSEDEFQTALEDAFSYDTKVIVEENISGKEIECSVLGNDEPIASLPGEIKPNHEFYDYDAKYIDENGAALEIPAKLENSQVKRIQELAIQAFKVLECSGMARVDFFLRDDGEVFVNEINTIPGFTKISMYPKLWEASGMSYSELIDRLVELALERYHKEQLLKIAR